MPKQIGESLKQSTGPIKEIERLRKIIQEQGVEILTLRSWLGIKAEAPLSEETRLSAPMLQHQLKTEAAASKKKSIKVKKGLLK